MVTTLTPPLTDIDDPLLGLGGGLLHACLRLLGGGHHAVLCHGESLLQNVHDALFLPSSDSAVLLRLLLLLLLLLPLLLLLCLPRPLALPANGWGGGEWARERERGQWAREVERDWGEREETSSCRRDRGEQGCVQLRLAASLARGGA